MLPLHSQSRNNGRVAQLNRVADYGSAGYRFESCRDHQSPLHFFCGGFCFLPHSIEEIRHHEKKIKRLFYLNRAIISHQTTVWLCTINRMFYKNTLIVIFKHQEVYFQTLESLKSAWQRMFKQCTFIFTFCSKPL